jgi:hypothetical protein
VIGETPTIRNPGGIFTTIFFLASANRYLLQYFYRYKYGCTDDTKMLSVNEAFLEALTYYNLVKQADKNDVANARSIYEDLAQRFPARRKKKTPAVANPA